MHVAKLNSLKLSQTCEASLQQPYDLTASCQRYFSHLSSETVLDATFEQVVLSEVTNIHNGVLLNGKAYRT